VDAIRGYLLGRCRRPEYWISVLVLIGCHIGLRFIPSNTPLAWLLVAAWFLLASRRLRDIGWSPWLSLAPIPAAIAIIVALLALAGRDDTPGDAISYVLAPLCLLVLWIGFWTVIGVWKSRASTTPTPQAQAEVFG